MLALISVNICCVCVPSVCVCAQDAAAGSLGAGGLRHGLLLSGGASEAPAWGDGSDPLGLRGRRPGRHRHSAQHAVPGLHHRGFVRSSILPGLVAALVALFSHWWSGFSQARQRSGPT